MAYIPGFEYDIFISYAHVDNATISRQASGWIEQFYKYLNLTLSQRFGRPDMIRIWWDDKKLDGSTLFNQSIADGIRKSAIMICLTSPGYLASDYCKQELDIFYQKAQQEKFGLKIADRTRIINVLLNNIPFTKFPEELTGTTGFHFHDTSEPGYLGDAVAIKSRDFREQLRKLRDAIEFLFRDMLEQSGTVQPGIEPIADPDKFTIYLGEVADTLRSPRKRVIAELEKKGYNVVAGIPPPDDGEAHAKATGEALATANLSIHMLDKYPGREIQGFADIWYPQKQAELALEEGKPQIIWVPAETDFNLVEEEPYKKFLLGLEAGNLSSQRVEFVRGSTSTIAQQIIDFAEQLKAAPIAIDGVKGPPSVLLDTHFNDQLHAVDLYNTLLANQIRTFINPQEDDPRKNINLLGERIKQVRKLIFYYGSVSREWVNERVSAALQLIITNNYPVENLFIYMAPPHKEISDITIRQKFLKVDFIDTSNNAATDGTLLNQFINELKN